MSDEVLGYLEDEDASADIDRILGILRPGQSVGNPNIHRTGGQVSDQGTPEAWNQEFSGLNRQALSQTLRSGLARVFPDGLQSLAQSAYDRSRPGALPQGPSRGGGSSSPLGAQFQGYPQGTQPPLPGFEDPRPSGQMSLFNTTRVHETNYYQPHTSAEAADWVDREPRELTGSQLSAQFGDDDDYTIDDTVDDYWSTFGFWKPDGPGEVEHKHRPEYSVDGPVGTTEMHKKYAQNLRGQSLGWDGPDDPQKIKPYMGLQFDDLFLDTAYSPYSGKNVTTYSTADDDVVGAVQWDETDWGTHVETAEIYEPFLGRGLSRDAMPAFFEHQKQNDIHGPIYADSFTDDGQRSFGNKGIPTEDDLEGYLDDRHQEAFQKLHNNWEVDARDWASHLDEEEIAEHALEDYDLKGGYLDPRVLEAYQEDTGNFRPDIYDDDIIDRDTIRADLTETYEQVFGAMRAKKEDPYGGRASPFKSVTGVQDDLFAANTRGALYGKLYPAQKGNP